MIENYQFIRLVIIDLATIIGLVIPMITCILFAIKGIKCLMRSEMLRIYYKYRDKEMIRQFELENFLALYKAYKALRGNSFIDIIYEEIITWKVIT